MNLRYSVILAGCATVLAGCSSMSGLDARDEFSCKAAPGVTCQSISGVHQNLEAENLPFQKDAKEAEGDNKKPVPAYGGSSASEKVSPKVMAAAYSGMPVREPPLILRVWKAPYEDEKGDLHDQSYTYMMVHSGKWLVEANRSNIRNEYRPLLKKPANVEQEANKEAEVRKPMSYPKQN